MSDKIIKFVNGKYIAQSISNPEEKTIYDSCEYLGYFGPSGSAESSADVVFRTQEKDGKKFISILVVQQGEHYLTYNCKDNRLYRDSNFLFENNTLETLAENCASESEAIKTALDFLHKNLCIELEYVKNLLVNIERL